MQEIKIVSRFDPDTILLCGKYESVKDCLEENRGANLGGAYLEGANLGGAKNYLNSHDFALEIIRRQPIESFTDAEWADIGKVAVHRFCWDKISELKNYESVLKKLVALGFGEYAEKIKGKK